MMLVHCLVISYFGVLVLNLELLIGSPGGSKIGWESEKREVGEFNRIL